MVEETETCVSYIRDHARIPVSTLLHLGCGAGANDYTFKRHFAVTGVDLSSGMLAIARDLNPEVAYRFGDMRDIRLHDRFDAVVIPDSIDYMVTPDELRKTIRTATDHLNPGGVLLIVANTSEKYRNNNFAYSGSRDGVDVTIFENNYISKTEPGTYEAVLVYLIRRDGELSLYTDRHHLGLFSLATWLNLFQEAGLEVFQYDEDHSYDDFLLSEGGYRRTVFVARKP